MKDRTFSVVGWPGFAGTLSGVTHGRFSVTLNAVTSSEPISFGKPVTFLIREVLEEAYDFQDALQRLTKTNILSDCLLLLCGTKENEMVVIERTPTKAYIRTPKNGYIGVTNDYKVYKDSSSGHLDMNNVLTTSSCGRYDRTLELLDANLPNTSSEVLNILSDSKVKMGITMQQMVFQAATGMAVVNTNW